MKSQAEGKLKQFDSLSAEEQFNFELMAIAWRDTRDAANTVMKNFNANSSAQKEAV